jgi:hypothetical protein
MVEVEVEVEVEGGFNLQRSRRWHAIRQQQRHQRKIADRRPPRMVMGMGMGMVSRGLPHDDHRYRPPLLLHLHIHRQSQEKGLPHVIIIALALLWRPRLQEGPSFRPIGPVRLL